MKRSLNKIMSYTAMSIYYIMKENSIDNISNINQKDLITDINKRTKVASAINELINLRYIEKIQIRNSNGRMSGVKYRILK